MKKKHEDFLKSIFTYIPIQWLSLIIACYSVGVYVYCRYHKLKEEISREE